jgi:hypothetical protein
MNDTQKGSTMKKEDVSLPSRRTFFRISLILCTLEGVLVIYGTVFPPMFFGNGVSSADVPNFELDYASAWLPFAVVLTLPLLSALFVLGTSAVSLFRVLSPRMVTYLRIAALVGLTIQFLVGYLGAVLASFSSPPHFGAGFWLALLGFLLVTAGTFLNAPRPMWR